MRVATILKPGTSQERVIPFIDEVDVDPELSHSLDAILVFGGDGTIHRHLHELYDLNVPVLVVPTGSGNDFASSLGIHNPKDALQIWRRFLREGATRTIDLGSALDSHGTTHLFCNVANFGLDSDINRRANKLPAFLRANGGYVLSLFPSLLRYSAPVVRLTIDGHATFRPITLAAAANGSRYGRGLKIAPRANMSDGLLDLCLVRETSRLKIAAIFPIVYFGRHLKLREVQYLKFRTMHIETPMEMDIYADGEFLCKTPATIAVMPGAVRVIAP